MKPLIAIVGKPNVGKSTFFNKVTGKKISIVYDCPGITRDRVYEDAVWNGKVFTLIDTGGLELNSSDEMWGHIKKQANIAIESADMVLFFTDVKGGITSSDFEVAQLLRRSKKKVFLVVNKADNYNISASSEFYNLGLGEPYPISSEHGNGIADLLDDIVKNFDKIQDEGEADSYLKIAIVGKPNAGKSSLVNKLLGFERTIVSDKAGTTRDSVDTKIEINGKKYIFIDTAGIRRKRSVEEDIEYYSVIRALGSIRRADVCLVTIDAGEDISEQDVKICGYVHEQAKPSVIVMNKWDLIEKDGKTTEKFNRNLREKLSFMEYFKPVYISALTGQRVQKVIELAEEVYQNACKKIDASTLNDVIIQAVTSTEPPTYKGRKLEIKRARYDGIAPPAFVFEVNDPELVHFSYKRYLENRLREAFDFSGTPIRLIFKKINE